MKLVLSNFDITTNNKRAYKYNAIYVYRLLKLLP